MSAGIGKRSFIAKDESDRSDAVVLAFSKIWLKNLMDQRPIHVFRKQSPSTVRPTQMVIYGGVPYKSFMGTVEIETIVRLSVRECLSIAAAEKTLPDLLMKYAKGWNELSAYKLKNYNFFKHAIVADDIQSQFAFTPPQNFLLPCKFALNWIKNKGESGDQ
jgi:predicted transcriptional regulator